MQSALLALDFDYSSWKNTFFLFYIKYYYFLVGLEFELRASCFQSRHSTVWALTPFPTLWILLFFFYKSYFRHWNKVLLCIYPVRSWLFSLFLNSHSAEVYLFRKDNLGGVIFEPFVSKHFFHLFVCLLVWVSQTCDPPAWAGIIITPS
jgi:hypothetical protein